MDGNFNNYNNGENNLNNNGNSDMQNNYVSGGTQNNNFESGNTDTTSESTGSSSSIYSYSYLNQDNQERNPNYYEKKEADSGNAQQNYTAGGYTSVQGNQSAGGFNSQQNSSQTYTSGSEKQPYWTKQTMDGKKEKKAKAPKIKRQHGFGMTVAKCAALALVFGLVSSTVFYGTGFAFKYTTKDDANPKTTTQSAEKSSGDTVNNGNIPATGVSTATTVTDVSDVVENVMPSIVSITNMMTQQEMDFFGRTYTQDTPSAGSGIIIGQTDEEIFIATNNHVVTNSSQLTVNFIDDQQVEAEIKGTDASTDLAVVSVKVNDIPSDTMDKIKVATLGKSEGIKVGESVVAIGNALGYGQSVTTGVISAMDREVTVQDDTTGATITNDLIQTDAAINPGNSGGALLNMNGEVIGINSVKYSDTQVEGMGYAIPISAAEPIIDDLITKEVVDESNSAYLGVSGQDVTSDLSDSFGMPEGLYITMVAENSAAEQAGIRKGDVLTTFAGRKVSSMEGLSDIMQYYAAGEEVEITLQTNENGEWTERTVTATLGKKND